MVIGESEQFVAEEDGIAIAVNIEVVDGEVVESFEALIGEE